MDRWCAAAPILGLDALTPRARLCFYAFMRTTVELPPELMRAAKARAAAHGESLKALLTRAVASELGKSRHLGEAAAHVRLPLFGNPKRKPVRTTSAAIARALADDDAMAVARGRGARKK